MATSLLRALLAVTRGTSKLPTWLLISSHYHPGTRGMLGSLGALGRRVDLEEGRQEEPHGAENAHKHEHPQEQAVDHHCDKFPVLDDLQTNRGWLVTGTK